MRLIDADRLKEEVCYNFAGDKLAGNKKLTIATIRDCINAQPTAKTEKYP